MDGDASQDVEPKAWAGLIEAAWPLLALAATCLVTWLGYLAWKSGHDMAFAVLVLAGVVGIGLERVAVAIRGRR